MAVGSFIHLFISQSISSEYWELGNLQFFLYLFHRTLLSATCRTIDCFKGYFPTLFSPPASHFFLLVYNLHPSFLGYTQHGPQVLMSFSQHLSADSGKGGSRAADLLRQRPQGWGLWNFLDVQSSGCHKDRPVRLGCQQCFWRYVGTSTSNVKRILSTVPFPSALTRCHSRGAILDILNILWMSCFRSPFVPF